MNFLPPPPPPPEKSHLSTSSPFRHIPDQHSIPYSSTGDSFLIISCPAMSFFFLWLEFRKAFWYPSLTWVFQSSASLKCTWSSLASSVGDSIESIGKRGFRPNKRKYGAYPVLEFFVQL